MSSDVVSYSASDGQDSDDAQITINLSSRAYYEGITDSIVAYHDGLAPQYIASQHAARDINAIYGELLKLLGDSLGYDVRLWFANTPDRYWNCAVTDWLGLDGTEIADELNSIGYYVE